MTMFHAVVWIDHKTAQVLQFAAEQALEDRGHRVERSIRSASARRSCGRT